MLGHSDLRYFYSYYVFKHFMEPIISATTTGLTITVEGASYLMQWIDSMLKVTGPDVCYYILETVRGLEQADCALKVFSVLMPN